MTATNPAGGAAIPVSVDTTRKVQGGSAIPVYGYMTAPTDGRPAMGGAAIPVRVLTAADLKQNGGMWTLEGRPYAMPVYTAPAGAQVQGGPALAVYPVNAWPTVPVVPAFAPTDIAGLQLWLKADAGLFKDAAKAQPCTADADAVYTWADQSGNGRDVVQATAGNRPAYKVNIKNGKPAVLFDGTDDLMDATGFTLAQPNTVFLVLSFPAFGTHDISFDGTSALSFHYFNRAADNTHELYAGASYIPGASVTGWQIDRLLYNGASSSLFRNGAQVGSAGNAGTNSLVGVRIGVASNATSPHNGYIAEVLVYNAAVSSGNATLIEAYLNTRWAVY